MSIRNTGLLPSALTSRFLSRPPKGTTVRAVIGPPGHRFHHSKRTEVRLIDTTRCRNGGARTAKSDLIRNYHPISVHSWHANGANRVVAAGIGWHRRPVLPPATQRQNAQAGRRGSGPVPIPHHAETLQVGHAGGGSHRPTEVQSRPRPCFHERTTALVVPWGSAAGDGEQDPAPRPRRHDPAPRCRRRWLGRPEKRWSRPSAAFRIATAASGSARRRRRPRPRRGPCDGAAAHGDRSAHHRLP